MTVSILQVLSTLPSGKMSIPLDFDQLGRYLNMHANRIEDKNRSARHQLRDELYRDGGCEYMCGVIDRVFHNDTTRKLRKEWVPHTRFNNALKRIVNELSTVYAEPAVRTVSDSDSNETLRLLQDELMLDELMLQANRLTNLHRAILAKVSVDQDENGDRIAEVDFITPANFRVVMHPNNGKRVVGWIIRTEFRPLVRSINTPHWVLWTDHERVFLREDMTVIGDSYEEHGLGLCPCIPITLGPRAVGFFAGEEGEDLVAAHTSIWFTNVLQLKETKSATKVPIVAGDTRDAARGQTMDSEGVVEVGDGTSVSTMDTSMDLSMFRDASDHVLGSAGNNYGMPPALLSHQGVQSAEARELMRIPIRELRNQQRIPFRRFERRLIVVLAAVLKVDLPARAFDPTGFVIEFGEAATPLSTKDSLDIFDRERAMGLDNTVAFEMRRNRDLTFDQAVERIVANVGIETWRNVMMRALQAINGSLSQNVGDAQTAAQNGTAGPDAARAAAADPSSAVDESAAYEVGADTTSMPPAA